VWTDTALQPSLTAAHLAFAILRRHRAGNAPLASPFVLPSFLLAITPWVATSGRLLAMGLLAHVAWLVACEILAPPPRQVAASPVPAPSPATPRPATPPAARAVASRPVAARPVAGPAPVFIPTSVLAVLEETPDIKTFRLARPEGFEFTAGQFVAVRVQIDGMPHVRCYSLSSSPDARGYLEISVRRQGLVSSTLHATLKPGARLAIKQPAGAFVYPAGDDRPLALVAGGVGITPLLSMLRFAISSDPTRPVTLLYSARRDEDLAFLSELRVVAERHRQVRVAITLTQAASSSWRRGRIDAAMLRQHVADPAHTIFCLCGPSDMISAMTGVLIGLGVPAAQIRSEKFDTAHAAPALNARPAQVPAAATAAAAAAYQVTFAISGRTAAASPARSLLEIAEAEGVGITSSCRAGVCQACRTRVAEGDADCRSEMLDAADRAAGYILPCVSFASSDCVLEA
jgi:ferredoxin-NADP reductase